MATYYFCLKNNKSANKTISAAAHINYINRKNVLDVKNSDVYQSKFLPKWAENSPLKFFKMADTYELHNAITYSEFEFVLPHELTIKQNMEIVNAFIAKTIPDKYYSLAIHKRQINNNQYVYLCNIMFSERLIDDVEKTNERSAARFFSRYNSKNPSTGGTKKDNTFTKSKNNKILNELHQIFVDITNEILCKYNINKRINSNQLVLNYKDVLHTVSSKQIDNLVFEKNSYEAKLRQRLKFIQGKCEKLEKQLASLRQQEQELKNQVEKEIFTPQSIKNTKNKQETKTGNVADNKTSKQIILTAYSAAQIKNLLTKLSHYLQENSKFNNPVMQRVVEDINNLKKIVNAQIIRDKYTCKALKIPNIVYFIKKNKEISISKENLDMFTEENNKLTDLKNTKIVDLKNAKIIAEAMAGNKSSTALVWQVKNDKITKISG